MKVSKALGLKESEIVSLVGGGGKTTLMFRLAEEIPLRYRVVITTTTKIFMPPQDKSPLVLLGKDLPAENDLNGYFRSDLRPTIGAGLLKNNKVTGISLAQLSLLQNYADIILVEADGSKGLSLKGHLDSEPVIAGSTTVLVVVIGADILGKALEIKYVHRPEIVSELTGRKMGSIIDAEMIAGLITHPEGILRDSPSNARVVTFINKADRLEDPGEGRRLGRLLLGEKIRKVILGSAIGIDPVLEVME
ncbi:MAG: selenium cofactor biosynthesis protein YqeC [Desulfotomaculaceae bacterium]|nr:selenium cofactor biosynthesis protein YqeC [Desulfotomaculaceae bacterium]